MPQISFHLILAGQWWTPQRECCGKRSRKLTRNKVFTSIMRTITSLFGNRPFKLYVGPVRILCSGIESPPLKPSAVAPSQLRGHWRFCSRQERRIRTVKLFLHPQSFHPSSAASVVGHVLPFPVVARTRYWKAAVSCWRAIAAMATVCSSTFAQRGFQSWLDDLSVGTSAGVLHWRWEACSLWHPMAWSWRSRLWACQSVARGRRGPACPCQRSAAGATVLAQIQHTVRCS